MFQKYLNQQNNLLNIKKKKKIFLETNYNHILIKKNSYEFKLWKHIVIAIK
jgi:hypothetical protein